MMADLTPTRQGTIPFNSSLTPIPCHTFYKIFGELNRPHAPPPIIVLHGGPGSGHEYTLPFAELSTLSGHAVVLYDQIGCGQSTHFRDKVDDKAFWSFDPFVAELENLLAHFEISTYHILGHSWGGIWGTDFAARRPKGLQRLALVGAASDMDLFWVGYRRLKTLISPASQSAIDEAIRRNDFTSPAYLAAITEFLRTYLCRAPDPWPPGPLAADFANQKDDPTVRTVTMGSTPWNPTGRYSHFSNIPLLPRITAPTLVLQGEFDTAQDETTRPFFEHIPRVRWITMAGSSHMGHLDSDDMRAKTLEVVRRFFEPSAP